MWIKEHFHAKKSNYYICACMISAVTKKNGISIDSLQYHQFEYHIAVMLWLSLTKHERNPKTYFVLQLQPTEPRGKSC